MFAAICIWPPGVHVQGAAATSSSMSTNRTPTTCPLRLALPAIASILCGSLRCNDDRNAHWSAKGSKCSFTNTLLPCALGSC
jgi:hypothetical protein